MSGITPLNMDYLQKEFKQFYRQVPRLASGTAVRFFKQNFRRQGWVYDGSISKWVKRAPGAKRNKGRAILISTGRLRRSIREIARGSDYISIGTDVEYAEIHNDGGNINGTFRVPAHVRKAHKVKAHTRKIGGEEKRMKASTRSAAKVGSHTRKVNMKIPQRQFIGESPDVIKSVERAIFRKLDQIIDGL